MAGDEWTIEDEERVQLLAGSARARGLTIAVAESLTAGRISSLLGRGESASEWYRGAVVAYSDGVRRLLHADVALSITGVGGPGPDEGCPAGTVHLAVAAASGTRSLHAVLPGDPSDVVIAATSLALTELLEALRPPARD